MAGAVLGKRSRQQHEHLSTKTSARKRICIVQDDSSRTTSCPSSHEDQSMHLDNSENTPPKPAVPAALPTGIAPSDPKLIASNTAPATPRHRDRPLSGSQVTTPKHRVTVGGKPFTPSTPRSASTPAANLRTVYNEARKTFTRGADPGHLVGRDAERAELETFITSRLAARTGGALYVSGPPGTGKTALVSEICRSVKANKNVHIASINCMSVKNATDIFVHATSDLEIAVDLFKDGPRSAFHAACVTKKKSMSYVLILDEVDQLLQVDVNTLYELFEWALAPHSKLVVVGIANALDLTDRFLPRLKARNLKPALLPFLPYSVAEMAAVLSARCRSLLPQNSTAGTDFTPFLHPTAIQLISKKVASQTGDLRKAFDIARRAIELVEADTKDHAAQQHPQPSPSKTPLAENTNLSSPLQKDLSSQKASSTSNLQTALQSLTAETAPRATPSHVVRVTTAVFSSNSLQHRFKGLNLQQKAILCCLVALEQHTRDSATAMPPSPQTPSTKAPRSGGAPTMRALLDAYTTLCKQDNILHALSGTEFRDVLSNLETASLVAAADGKAGSLALARVQTTPRGRKKGGGFAGAATGDERRISACIGRKDIEGAVDGVGADILKSILGRAAGTGSLSWA